MPATMALLMAWTLSTGCQTLAPRFGAGTHTALRAPQANRHVAENKGQQVDEDENYIIRAQNTPFSGRPLPRPPQVTTYGAGVAPANVPPAGGYPSVNRSPAPFAGNLGSPGNVYGGSSVTVAPSSPGNGGPSQLPLLPPQVGDPNTNYQLFPENRLGGQEPDRYIDLDAVVEETQTGRFSFGVGVNSDAGVIGTVVIDEQNFDWRRWPRSFEEIRNGTAWRGAGQRFRLEAMPGTEVERYAVSFQEPYLFDSLVSLGLSGFFYQRQFFDWDEERLGGRVSFGYQFSPDLTGTIAFRGEQIDISDIRVPSSPQLAAAQGTSDLYSVRFQVAHDTRDNAFLPTEGHLIELGYEQAFGTYDFPRVTLDGRQYFLVRERPDGTGRHVLSLVGRFGVTGSQTPVFENFFAGGFSTLRGFEFRGASPREMTAIVGGELQLLGSVEYLFPITADDMLRGVLFTDFGTVEESINIDGDDFRVAPGVGLRIMVPALSGAPIALDLAFPIAREGTDRIQNFSFFVGLTR